MRRAVVLFCAVALIGCASLPQRIASATATVAVSVERSTIAWYNEQSAAALDQVASEGGGIPEYCEAVREAHQTSQRIFCGADALADLAVAGQQLVDAGQDSGSDWTAWLAGVPPVLVALEDAFAAGHYSPPSWVTSAISALEALIGVVAPGAEALPPCEVTDLPAECLQSREPAESGAP